MKHKYAIGIGLNIFEARSLLLRDDGKVIAQITKNRKKANPNETIEILLNLFDCILEKSKKYKKDLAGAGVALGGIVSSRKGVVYLPQNRDSYISLPLQEHLKKKSGLDIFVDNDATACLWAEYKSNFSKQKDIIYMFSGVGCGIMINGDLYRGRDGAAGELFLNPEKIMASRLGDFSFLKQWPIDLGITKRAKEIISLGKESALIKKISSVGELSLESVFEEAQKKDKVAREALKEGALALGAKIAFLINFLNPELVIIGGGLEKGGEIFLDECINAVKRFAFHEMRKNCKIVLSKVGIDATSLGAAMVVFKEKALHV